MNGFYFWKFMHTLGYLGENVLNPALDQLGIAVPIAAQPDISILSFDCQRQIEPPALTLHRLVLEQLVRFDRFEDETFYAEYPVDPNDPYWFAVLRCGAIDRHLYGDNVTIHATTMLVPHADVHADWDEDWFITPAGVTRSFVPFEDEPTGVINLNEREIYGLYIDLLIGGAARPPREKPNQQ